MAARIARAFPLSGASILGRGQGPLESDTASQRQNDNDDEEQADDTARTVSPAAAVAPDGEGADQLSWSRLSEQLFRVDKWSVCRG